MYKSRLIYLAIAIAAFVFSQALYESVSFMTLVIILVLPIVSVLFALLSYPLVSVKLSSGNRDVCRFDKIIIRLTILNKSPLISPSFKINCSVPDDDGKKIEQVVFVLNSAFARRGYFDYECFFANRGINTVKAESVEYYDFLKLIKIKKNISKAVAVKVNPRRLDLNIPVGAELNTQENSNIAGVVSVLNGGDMMGVREYLLGDNLKNVHWKLSAKNDDLVMKSFVENVFDKAFVIADLSAYYADIYQNKSMTDCVVEAALSAIRDYSKSSVRFGLIINTGKGLSEKFSIATPTDLYEAEQALSVAPMVTETSILDLLNSVDFNMLSGCEVCIITSFGISDILKNIQKMFIDKKSKLNVINISEYESNDNHGVTVYTREYIEKQGRIV